jgi:L-amino acid N-acyltransferase YncA
MARHNSEAGASTTKAIFNDNLHGEENPDLEQVRAQAKALVGGAAAVVDAAQDVQGVYVAIITELAGSDAGKKELHNAVSIMLEAGTTTSNEEMPGVLAALAEHAGYKNLRAFIQVQSDGTLRMDERTRFASKGEMENEEGYIKERKNEQPPPTQEQVNTMQRWLELVQARRAEAITAGLNTEGSIDVAAAMMEKAADAVYVLAEAMQAYSVPSVNLEELPPHGIRGKKETVENDKAYVNEWTRLDTEMRTVLYNSESKVHRTQKMMLGTVEATRVADMVAADHLAQLNNHVLQRQALERETFKQEMARVGIKMNARTGEYEALTLAEEQRAAGEVALIEERETERVRVIEQALQDAYGTAYTEEDGGIALEDIDAYVEDMLAYKEKVEAFRAVDAMLEDSKEQRQRAVKLLFNHSLHTKAQTRVED